MGVGKELSGPLRGHTIAVRYFAALVVSFLLGGPSGLAAQPLPEPAEIINRARATVGTPAALDGLVTLRLVGVLTPADATVPPATLVILARKPSSHRLEIRIDDMVETTILNGKRGCLVRSNLEAGASRMRELTRAELERVRHTTRQLFNFYRPDFQNGERVTHEGLLTHRDERVHKLRYAYPEGFETVRYFSVNEDRLVSVVSANGVESVNVGEQWVGGIKYPERVDYFENGEKLHSVAFHEIEVNKPLPAGVFEFPSGAAEN